MRMRGAFSYRPMRRQRGAASVEFYVVSFFVFFPMLMAVLQMGFFFVAKNTVNLATFAAARAGAVTSGDRGEMRTAFSKALSPLYVSSGLRLMNGAGFTDLSGANYAQVMAGAYATAYALTMRPLIDDIRILNPTPASFTDFGVRNPNGGSDRIIPVTNLLNDVRVGASSRQTRADALLLKVEARHCYEMIFPMINRMVTQFLLINPLSPPTAADAACYAMTGVPIVSQAVVRMTVPPSQRHFR